MSSLPVMTAEEVSAFWDEHFPQIQQARDIAIVAGLLWVLIAWVREARARIALGGVFAIAMLYWTSRWLDLRLTTTLLQGFIAVAALVLVACSQGADQPAEPKPAQGEITFSAKTSPLTGLKQDSVPDRPVFYVKIENTNDTAVSAFSPPLSNCTDCSFLPGGWEMMSIPLSSTSSVPSMINSKRASPPRNKRGNTFWNIALVALNASVKRSREVRLIFKMAERSCVNAISKSAFCVVKNS